MLTSRSLPTTRFHPGKLIRRDRRLTAAVALFALVVLGTITLAVGHAADDPDLNSPAQDGSPSAAAQNTPEALTSTQIRVFVPFSPDGLSKALTVKEQITGECFSTSLASPARPDAWRCMANNAIYDPCFAQIMGDGTQLACASSPWETSVSQFTTTKALEVNSGKLNWTSGMPWALELENVQRCTLLTGATFGIAGLRVNYGCDKGGSVVGEPDRSRSVWTVLYYANDGGYALEQAGVAVAWY
jgi:hypothetical protein